MLIKTIDLMDLEIAISENDKEAIENLQIVRLNREIYFPPSRHSATLLMELF